MKTATVLAFTLATAASSLPAAEPLEPDDDASIRASDITGFEAFRSPDNKIHGTVVFQQRGHTYNDNQPWVTFWQYTGEGDGGHSTTYRLPRINGGKPRPEFKLTKIGERHYRFAYDGSYNAPSMFNHAMLSFSYDITLDDEGLISRVEPRRIYSSYWDYDGSLMGLVVSGKYRTIYYVKPEEGSGFPPGSVFFHGTSDGKTYAGKILYWKPFEGEYDDNDSPLAYEVSGSILEDGAKVVLKGKPVDLKDGKLVARDTATTHTLTLDSAPKPGGE